MQENKPTTLYKFLDYIRDKPELTCPKKGLHKSV